METLVLLVLSLWFTSSSASGKMEGGPAVGIHEEENEFRILEVAHELCKGGGVLVKAYGPSNRLNKQAVRSLRPLPFTSIVMIVILLQLLLERVVLHG